MDLLEYDSSDDDGSGKPAPAAARQPLKPPAPQLFDDETDATGKKRRWPHTEGLWPSYVYLEVDAPPATARAVARAYTVAAARASAATSPRAAAATAVPAAVASDRSSSSSGGGGSPFALGDPPPHVSLSKTLLLRASEVDGLHDRLADALRGERGFPAALEGAQVFVNEDGSRSFVGLLPSTGHDGMRRLLAAVDAVVTAARLPPFYDPPILHASVAWAPGDVTRPEPAPAAPDATGGRASTGSSKRARVGDDALSSPAATATSSANDDVAAEVAAWDGGAATQLLLSAEDAAAAASRDGTQKGAGGGSTSSSGSAAAADAGPPTFLAWTVRDVCFKVGRKVYRLPLAPAPAR